MLQFALMEYVNGVLARATKSKPKEQENDQPGYFSDSEYIKVRFVYFLKNYTLISRFLRSEKYSTKNLLKNFI